MNSINYNSDRILYSLTHPQKRIWYIEKIYPGTSLYNIGDPIKLIHWIYIDNEKNTFHQTGF